MTPTPTLPPGFTGDPNVVSPGVIGFIVIFLIAAATVLLVVDMTRRIRRVRYRDEARERIAQEQAEQEQADQAQADQASGEDTPTDDKNDQPT